MPPTSHGSPFGSGLTFRTAAATPISAAGICANEIPVAIAAMKHNPIGFTIAEPFYRRKQTVCMNAKERTDTPHADRPDYYSINITMKFIDG
jgi:hypothetical protein